MNTTILCSKLPCQRDPFDRPAASSLENSQKAQKEANKMCERVQHPVTMPALAWHWFDLAPVAPSSQVARPNRLRLPKPLVSPKTT